MERTSKIILLSAISIAAIVSLSGLAYAQTTRASTAAQCASMIGNSGMGMMGGNGGMMGGSSNSMGNCQSIMDQSGTSQCQNMVSQSVERSQGMIDHQSTSQSCH